MASCFPKIDRQRRKRKPSAAPAAAVGVGVVDEEQGKSNRPRGFLLSRRKDPPVTSSSGNDDGNKFAGGGGGDAMTTTRWNDGDFSIGCVTDEEGTNIVMEHQTKMIRVLRAVVFLLLVSLATVVCVGVFLYTKREEEYSFREQYEAAADDVLESFYEAVERKLEAVESMSTAITSYALSDNNNKTTTFPFVTMPNFAVLGSAMRVQAEASILHWMPLVYENQRNEWEEYAANHRHQIDEAFLQDKELRHKQDVAYGYADDARLLDETDDAGEEELLSEEELVFVAGGGVDGGSGAADRRGSRLLEKNNAAPPMNNNESIFDDGTGFHPHLWSTGAITPRGDEPTGGGPYLPLWQRSPINGAKQKLLNINFANTKVFSDVLPVVLRTHQAVMNSAQVPLPKYQDQFRKNLAISQYKLFARADCMW